MSRFAPRRAAAFGLSAALVLSACSADSTVAPETGSGAPSNGTLVVTPESDSLLVGDAKAFLAFLRVDGGTTVSPKLTGWTSSDTSVAFVGADGVVEGRKPGEVEITALSGIRAGVSHVRVKPGPTSTVEIRPTSASLRTGESVQLQATAFDARGNERAVSGGMWTTANSSIVAVSQTGLVTGLALGSTTVTLSLDGRVNTIGVAVVPTGALVATVVPAAPVLTAGQSMQLGAMLKDQAGVVVPNASFTWTVDNSAVARVSSAGVVTAVAEGSARVVATSGQGPSAAATLTVTRVPVTNVMLSPSGVRLTVGQSATLTASASDAQSNPLTGRIFTFSSSSPAIATVSAEGVVTAVAPGTVTITATTEGKSAAVAVTVAQTAVASVGVTPTTATLVAGASTALSAKALDASGATLTGRTITWSSSNAAIAQVSTAGTVTGMTAGTATITATSEGQSATATITVTAVPVAAVSVSAANASLLVGGTTQVTATATSATGAVLSGRSVGWSTSDPAMATVNAQGVVTATGAGAVTIIATVDGRQGGVGITITAAPVTTPTPVPAPTGNTVAPALPRSVVDASVAATPSNGRILRVNAGGNLQLAIDTARLGDQIHLEPGATWVGTFVLRNKPAGSGWITIRTAGALPAENVRMTKALAAQYNLPKLHTVNAERVIRTEPGAHHYRIMGIEVSAQAGVTMTYSLVTFGEGGAPQTSLASVPSFLVLDRSYVHGTSTLNFQRCVALNSANSAVVSSTLSECHGKGMDSQAIWGSNGPGPFLIENNYLEGAGENVMFGGSDPAISNLVPSDITIRGNHFGKPLSWQGVWSVKNLFELKNAQRVLVEGNVFQNNWVDAQIGFALIWKSTNQDGGAPWSTTSDVTFRYNIVRNTANVLSIAGNPEQYPAVRAARFQVMQNIFENIGSAALGGIGRVVQVDNSADVELSNNSGLGVGAGLLLVGNQGLSPRLRVLNNVIGGYTGINSADGQGSGTQALDYYAGTANWTVLGNVFVREFTNARFPDGNLYATSASAAGIDPLTGALIPGGVAIGRGTNGSNPGPDRDAVLRATANAVKE